MKFATHTSPRRTRQLVVGQASRPHWTSCGRDALSAGETPAPLSFEAAFTLAEVLAALVFMAILIPVALEGLSLASKVGETATRKGEAALVAERILNESIITTNWNHSVQSGTLRQGPREFPWTIRNDPWNQDPNQTTMRLVSVEVKYFVQGQEHAFTLTTLADNAAPAAASSLLK